jgi:hypothetical protein
MHVRISTRRRGAKVYRYVQLVQSYRRPDGMPAHKVLASLGDLPDAVVENLRRALKASREGKNVLLPDEVTSQLPPRKVRANLHYLDVAVAYRLWNQWKLSPLLEQLMDKNGTEVPVPEMVAALVAQRCVAPGSKLSATRWFPKTALPELQAIPPGKFNNTRIHHTLELLETVEADLQQSLARRINARAAFSALYLDVTDTWFAGRGPDLAYNRVTKDGIRKRRIGIVLLCDEKGFPLRWATVAGNHYETDSMMTMLRQVHDLGWAQQVPFVVDRAMGRGATVNALWSLGLRFVTAVPANEMTAYSEEIPLGAFDEVELELTDRHEKTDLAALGQAALAAGFERISANRYVLDLGVVQGKENASSSDSNDLEEPGAVLSSAQAVLAVAERLQWERNSGQAKDLKTLARTHGVSSGNLHRWLKVLRLNSALRQRIVAGEADRIPLSRLLAVAALPEQEQSAAFEAEREAARSGRVIRPVRALKRIAGRPPVQVRAVVLFNPERFVEQRRSARTQMDKLDAFIEKLNARLRSPRSRLSRNRVLGKIGNELARRHLTDTFESQVDKVQHEGRTVLQAQLERNDQRWNQRRNYDGLTLIVTHPDVPGAPGEIVALYFAKDMVEKDFQAIKSVIALRPVRHYTNPKVRAHVTLCMLSLLLERTLEKQLREAGIPMTAAKALEELSCCHLNYYPTDEAPVYSVTEPSPDQRRIIDALGMSDLTDDDRAAEFLEPR